MSALRRAVPVLVGASLVALALSALGTPWHDTLERLASLRWTAAAGVVGLGWVQIVLLMERWRLWEARAGTRWSRLDAMDAMSASTLISMSFGPFAGDLARGLSPHGIRVRGVIADRLGNTALAFALAAAVYASTAFAALAGVAAVAFLIYRFGRVGVWTTLLTLSVFAAIAGQLILACQATGVVVEVEALLYGVPALLVASLIPISLLGFTGKEASLPLVYGAFTADASLAVASVLAAASLVAPALWYLPRAWSRRGATSQSPREAVPEAESENPSTLSRPSSNASANPSFRESA